jgi:carboxymethylenebutenolidase
MKSLIKRFAIGTGILIASLIAFLVLSVGVDFAIGGDRIMEVTNTFIPGIDGQPDVRAYVARPAGSGPFPVVIMIHEFYGLNESIVGKAEGLAEEGFLVIAPDTFRGYTTSWIPRAIFQVISTDPQQVNLDLDSIFTWLEEQPDVEAEHIAIAGFCYGGRAALAYSLHNTNIAATVIFYGSPITDPEILKTLPGPVLGIFGSADNSIPISDVSAFETSLNQAGIKNEITIYPGQPHAFVTDMDSIRQGGVQRQAWDQMVKFLQENIQSSTNFSKTTSLVNFTALQDWGYYLRLAMAHFINAGRHAH